MTQVQRPGPGSVVTVVGLARSGFHIARWLQKMKCVVRVTEREKTAKIQTAACELEDLGISVELGKHTRGILQGAEMLVTSPGVAMTADPLRWAAQRGIPVVSELECASWYCSGRMVAVTGSNGKSTVVTMLTRLLQAAGQDAVLCGNIGFPLSAALSQIRPSTVVVTEVSSFQLEGSLSFHPQIACILNITRNHLDRHGSWERYRALKGRLLAHQGRMSWAILNADDSGARSLYDSIPGTPAMFSRTRSVTGSFMKGGSLFLNLPWISQPICRVEELAAAGIHHEENGLAVICLAGLLGVAPDRIREGISSFEGLPHRQQRVGTVRGVTFINDSKATTVAAGVRAIECAPGPVVLIAGGRDKGSDFTALSSLRRKLKAVVLIGEDGRKIGLGLQGRMPLVHADSLEEAVLSAAGLAKEGECVLLSPMCTSFDMFRDFEERGDRFVEAVKALSPYE